MARRVIIGNDGSGRMRIRTSMPGYDAATAPLDGLLFDADAIPGRIISEGQQYCHWYMHDNTAAGLPQTTAIPHYATGNFIIIGIAKAMYEGGSLPPDWRLKSRKIVNGVASIYFSYMGGAATGNYLTPFYISGDHGGGHTFWYGWKLRWDSENIIIDNYLANGLWLRWQALEV